jgi:hypothetical protein
MIVMHDDFRDFLRDCLAQNVECMIVGGYAYGIHAQPRATKDLDVWVNPTRENLERFAVAVKSFIGASINVDELLGLLETNKLGFVLGGIEPYKIEVLLRLKEVTFEEAHANMLVFTDPDGLEFPVISAHDLIRAKRAAGRTRDLADVQDLIRLYGEPNP